MKLAIQGGKSIRDTYLAYGKQQIDDQDIERVVQVLKSEYLTTGPAVQEFEQKVADYVNAKYAVAVSNGTAALHVALFGCGIEAGDEVIVTPMTFAASSNAILYMGAVPVFADIDPSTYNLDVRDVERKITDKTKAIVVVDFAGQPVDIEEFRSLANKYNLKLVQDSAHSLGSTYGGEKIGSLADVTTFSFHPVKPITTGEGGMIVTNNEGIYKRMMMFRTHGITRDAHDYVNENEGNWHYEQQYLGYNYRLTDIGAALGISQMDKLDGFLAQRRKIVEMYQEAFSSIEGLIIPYEKPDRCSGWHIYVVRINLQVVKASRGEVFKALQAENIGVNVHYVPVYYHPYYHQLGYEKGLCPVAENVYDTMMTLPLYPGMTMKDVADVIEGVKKVIAYYSK